MSDASSRRTFIKQSGVLVAGAAIASSISRASYAAGNDTIKFALVGCGGRGSGAADQIMNSKGNVKLMAVADAFENKAQDAIKNLSRKHKDKIDVPNDRVFVGLDAYKKAIDAGVDLVVIATPPGFKTPQFEYAVKQGKHIFCEKPIATDAPGVRRFMAAVEESKKKNLMVGIGLQRHHEPRYIETVKRLHDGAIGDIIALRVYWDGNGIWYRNKMPGQSEMAFQCNNWYHFNWACGDQICEQHIHNLDVGCWVKGAYPVECNGMGGGEQRMGGDRTKSQIFDHTFCEYTFPDGTKMFSQGRHLQGGWQNVSEFAHGSKGTSDPSGWIKGENNWTFKGDSPGGHQQEQLDLIDALMRGEIYNEGEYGAKSTFTAILGREACYSGKVLKWDELLAKGTDLCPGIDTWTLDSAPPPTARPDKDGKYPYPVPGQHNPFA
ncbi:MAG: twin-arginine translocation signal domain-containing protein [Planctomycetes bacterium]|nr:twin-arginine translocation signal domain-containing protein [Planctomycetota bacterium]